MENFRIVEIDEFSESVEKSCADFICINEKNIEFLLNKDKQEVSFSEPITSIDKKSWGVYVFYIIPKEKITYKNLKEKWKKDSDDKPIDYLPKFIEENEKKLTVGEPMCFYVGKSQKLSYRIQQHINQQTKSTYGLQLYKHNNLHSDFTFEYSYIEIPPNESKYGMECLLVALEKHLRDTLKPLVGKQ